MRASSVLRASPERSFETLYRRHAAHVYRSALALLGSRADAEEVTQATFLNAYRAIERGERPRHPGAWLQTIALNLCRQRFRQAARRPSEVPLEDDVAELVVEDQDPTIEDLTRALKHLPFNQRAALVMREFEGLTPPEIARSLELSTSAVEALLFRARRSLREQLQESITCQQAERALSQQLDGRLARAERGALRAHLRECDECARLARSMRAQRGAMKSLAFIPIPSALASAPQIGAGASAVAGGTGVGAGAPLVGTLAAKLAVGAAATALIGGASYEAVTHHTSRPRTHHHALIHTNGRGTSAARHPAPATSVLLGRRATTLHLAAPAVVGLPGIHPKQQATKPPKTASKALGARPQKTAKAVARLPKRVTHHATTFKKRGSSKPAKTKHTADATTPTRIKAARLKSAR